jgi:Zn-dependent peptidase ImmA (M78 family)/transcriptional regulator with XRE-family HTH domain
MAAFLEASPSVTQAASGAAIGERVRQAREALGLTQKGLADLVELPAAQTVSEIEHGRRDLRPAELVRIARALHTEVDILLGLQEQQPRVGVLWRRAASGTDGRREAQLRERAERYAQLERWCGAEPPKHVWQADFAFSRATADEAGALAEHVRRVMDLGSIPAATLLRTLEETYGVKVFWDYLTSDADGDCSAACMRGEFGSAVLLDASEVPWRRTFSLAHELFHLLTWEATASTADASTWPRRIEGLADAFAGTLLMPADSLTDRFRAGARDGKITYGELVRLAREFGVSTHALLIRLRYLRHIQASDVDRLRNDQTFRRVDRMSWAEIEKPDVPFSRRYTALAYSAFQQGTIGVSMLAKYLETPIADLELPQDTVEDASEAALTVV